jgi:hypothetical protein
MEREHATNNQADVVDVRCRHGSGEKGVDRVLAVELRFPAIEGRSTVYHLHFVIDVSASMNDGRMMPLIHESLRRALRAMRRTDRISITLFAHDAVTIVRQQTVAACLAAYDAVRSRIDQHPLMFTAKTYLETALADAARWAARRPEWLHRVVVMTDGEIMDVEYCLRQVRELGVSRAEYRGLGLGASFHGGALRDALSPAPAAGPIQRIEAVEDIPDRIVHLVDVGEVIVGSDLVMQIGANGGQRIGWAMRQQPGVRRLMPGDGSAFCDSIPILESARTYRYLLGLEVGDNSTLRGADGREVVLEGQFAGAGETRGVESFRIGIPLSDSERSSEVDRAAVGEWVDSVAPDLFGEDAEFVLRSLRALIANEGVDGEIGRRLVRLAEEIRQEGLSEETYNRFCMVRIDASTRLDDSSISIVGSR